MISTHSHTQPSHICSAIPTRRCPCEQQHPFSIFHALYLCSRNTLTASLLRDPIQASLIVVTPKSCISIDGAHRSACKYRRLMNHIEIITRHEKPCCENSDSNAMTIVLFRSALFDHRGALLFFTKSLTVCQPSILHSHHPNSIPILFLFDRPSFTSTI